MHWRLLISFVYWWVVVWWRWENWLPCVIAAKYYPQREDCIAEFVTCLSYSFFSLLLSHLFCLPFSFLSIQINKHINHVDRSKGSKARDAREDSPGRATSVQGGQVDEWKLRCIIQKCRRNGGAIHCISCGAEWVAQEPRRWWMQHSLGFDAWCHCVWCCLFNEDTSQRRIMFGILWSASEKLLQWIRIQILCVWS